MIKTGTDIELYNGLDNSLIGTLGFGEIEEQKSMYKQRLMAEHRMEIRFEYPYAINLERGDYVIYNGIKFALRQKPAPEFNSNRSYEYRLDFDAPEMFLQDQILFYTFQGLEESAWNLTSQPLNFMKIFVEAADPIMGGGWTVGVVEPENTVNIQFDGDSIWDGFIRLAKTTECEWYLDYENKTFNLVKSYEYGNYFKLPENVAVIDMRQTNANEEDYFTRLLIFGGTQNIPRNYRTPATGTAVDAIVQKKLRMPKSYGNYIDFAPNIPEYMKKTKIVTFDHIFPKRISTISDIEINDKATDENGNPFIIYYIKDDGLKFKSEYILSGETLRVTFEIGSWLAGRTFDLAYHSTGNYAGYFEIINDQTTPELVIPNEVLKPRVGDKFVLTGFDIQLVSDQYIPDTEEELKKEALEYANSMMGDNATYTCVVNPVYAAHICETLKIGQRVELHSNAFVDGMIKSRVNELAIDLVGRKDKYMIGAKPEYYRNTRNLRQSVAKNKEIADMQYLEAMKANRQNYQNVQALNYIRTALENSTTIDGGLVLTTLIQLGLLQGDVWVNTAGVNGVYENDSDVAFWAGGTLDQAINLVKNPQATENVANFVVTHGGQVIMNKALVRGRFESNANGNRIVIDPDDRSIKMISGDALLAKWSFEQNTSGAYRPTLQLNDDFDTTIMRSFGIFQTTKNANGINTFSTTIRPGQVRLKGFDNNGAETSGVSISAENTLRIDLEGLPTSKESLKSGTLWRDGELLKIVP